MSLTYSFPNLEPVCSMSSSNCCFLTCIQISQEAGNVVWYSISWRIFHSCDLHKVFGIVKKAHVDIFLKLSCFYCDPTDVGSLVSGSSDFSKFTLTSVSSQFIYCLCLSWRILMITLLVCEMLGIVRLLEHSLALPFIGTGMKTDIFQSCGHSWVFHICWHIECSTFTASSFRIWNSSTGIPSLHWLCS